MSAARTTRIALEVVYGYTAPVATPPAFNVPENTDHVEEALSLLIEQYKDKADIESLLSSYVGQIQKLETVFYDLYEKFLLDYATDAQLDVLGKIVGEERADRTDAVYRSFIKARIAINKSNGRIEELINILGLIAASGAVFDIQEYDPAAMVVYQTGDPNAFEGEESVFIDILKQAKAGGVNIQFLWSDRAAGNRFQFASGNSIETSPLKGYSDTSQATGGHYSGVVN